MKLTLAEKLGLIYSASGSQRKVASVVGLSHQTVGRILHKGMLGESLNRYADRPDVVAAIERGFASHVALTKSIAKRDGLPFTSAAPVFSERMTRTDGKPSDRTLSAHTHWLSDRVRNAWIKHSQQTGKFVGVTVRSKVNLRHYAKQAAQRERARQTVNTPDRVLHKLQLKKALRDGAEIKPVFTPTTNMRAGLPAELVIADIEHQLRVRHQPATGEKGTSYADQIVMQLKRERGGDDDQKRRSKEKQRTKSPGPTKRGKTRKHRGARK